MNDLPSRRAFNRRGAATLEKQIDDALAQQKTERDAAWEAARASEQEQKALQGSISRADLITALDGLDPLDVGGYLQVQDRVGWHFVVRVNKTTVTVPGPWGGLRTIRIDKLIEVKS